MIKKYFQKKLVTFSVILFLLIINQMINFIPYMYPRISLAIIKPYKLWIAAIAVFYFTLPSKNMF
jgi:hypothetical protein